MPELPEVETTLLGVKPHILNKKITRVIIRHHGLRWPIPHFLPEKLEKQSIKNISRRGKYLLFKTQKGTLIIHLGMSGSLRILTKKIAPQKHDHVDFEFGDKLILRFNDPRRFGAILWTEENIDTHPLLKNLGIEPLEKTFAGKILWEKAQNKKVNVKVFIMNSNVVTGVGNIYATEALFDAKIHPNTIVSKVSLKQFNVLAKSIKKILNLAITKGGTTLKNFSQTDGKPGYFSLKLKAYGKEGSPCPRCKTKLVLTRIAQRSTVFCPCCQKC